MILIFALAMTGMGRVASVSSSKSVKAAADNNCSIINFKTLRGTVYDTNMRFITNSQTAVAAVIYPTEEAISQIEQYIAYDTENIMNTLKNGKAAVAYLHKRVWIDGVECFNVKIDDGYSAIHAIGYVGGNSNGATGLQKSYNDLLSVGNILVKIPIMASGKPILSEKPSIIYDKTKELTGVITTLDLNIQKIAEEAADSIKSGAVVITEVGNGKIRALVSKPNYSVDKIYESLNDESSPLINRALSAYNVGSVFKPCIAAASLERGFDGLNVYTCFGKSEIAGRNFKCNNLNGHGKISLSDALGKSCNCYFYSLALDVGADSIYKLASSFPFNNNIKLAKNLSCQKGKITDLKTLQSSDAAIANFAIGQGDIMLSPVAVSTLYEAIAGGGIYYTPTLIEGTVENGAILKEETYAPTRVFSEKTADIIKNSLIQTLIDGTGTKGKPEKVTAAGKTATAETGWKKNGKKVTQGWFCGFFPAENPKYVVVILSEGAASGGSVCAPVFKTIADAVVDAGLLG